MTTQSIIIFFVALITYWVTKLYNAKVKNKEKFLFAKFIQDNWLAGIVSMLTGVVALFILPEIFDNPSDNAVAAIAGYFNGSVMRFITNSLKA